jgi:DNA repair exonuclease SbcCD ATPase subunit
LNCIYLAKACIDMSDIDDLWARIDDAKRRLGAADEVQIKRIEDLNERIKAVKAGLATRYRELEAQRDEVSKLRRENEQLRQMMHRLLLAIEERYSGRLKGMLQDLETQVSGLVSVAEPPNGQPTPASAGMNGPPAPDDRAKAAQEAPSNDAAPNGESGKVAKTETPPEAAPPSEKDSRWLHEIMERARELTVDRARANRVTPLDPTSRSAVA